MTNKLDLVVIYINGIRHALSKWLSLGFDDMVLLSGYELYDDLYCVKYRFPGYDDFLEVVEGSKVYLKPSRGLEILVTIKNTAIVQENDK